MEAIMKFGLFIIPDEVARLIFLNLDGQTLACLALVSTEFWKFSDRKPFWERRARDYFNLIRTSIYDPSNELALLDNFPIQYSKNMMTNIHKLRHRDLKAPWQIVLLSENMAAIQTYFSIPGNLDSVLDLNFYSRFDFLSPLHYAVYFGNTEMFNYFHALGIPLDVPALEYADFTPFHCAALLGNVDFMKFLHSKGANPAVVVWNKQTAAHYCARSGNVDALRYALTTLNLSATRLTTDGDSLLHLAAMNGKKAPVEYLLHDFPKIDIFHKNKKGEMAVNCARGEAKAVLEQKMSELGHKPNGCTIS
jgi:hypothetical protein